MTLTLSQFTVLLLLTVVVAVFGYGLSHRFDIILLATVPLLLAVIFFVAGRDLRGWR